MSQEMAERLLENSQPPMHAATAGPKREAPCGGDPEEERQRKVARSTEQLLELQRDANKTMMSMFQSSMQQMLAFHAVYATEKLRLDTSTKPT